MSKFPKQYILKNGKPVREPDILKWGKWFGEHHNERIVEQTTIKKRRITILISTVFLGLDHNWNVSGKPVLWETMVFNGPNHRYQVRYASLATAKKGHAEVVEQEQRIQAQRKQKYTK